MHQVSLLERALMAEELSQALIFFATTSPCFLRFLKLAQKHFSACASLWFLLVFVLPWLSIISPSIWVFCALGMRETSLSAMACSLKVSFGKWCVASVTEACGACLEHGFHWNPASRMALVTSFIISCASVGFRAMIKMLTTHMKWLIFLPCSLKPVPCACRLLVTGCMTYFMTLLNSAGVRVPPWMPPCECWNVGVERVLVSMLLAVCWQ